MSESKKQNTLDLEEKLASLHPRFLESLRQVYPLAVLGSLCIAISAFAHQSYPEAQAFALASASLFLTAFVLSFLFEIFKKIQILALMSYTSTALAVFLLFIAILEFGVTTPMVARTFSTALGLVGLIFISSLYYSMVKMIKKTESKLAHVVAWLSISCGVLFDGTAMLGLLYLLLSGEYIYVKIDFFPALFLSLLSASLTFAVIFLLFAWRELKKKKSEVS
jgi:uncharacterized membrane protein